MTTPWRPEGLAALALLHIQLDVDQTPLVECQVGWSPCFRIIASEYAGENLFDRLVNELPYTERQDEAEGLQEIADLTNPYVASEAAGIPLVHPEDQVYGPGKGLIMSAFAYPGTASRFSDGSAGTYYAASRVETAIVETRYHADRYLVGSGPCEIEKTLIEADLEGSFLDVRRPNPAPPGIYHPTDYTAAQALGRIVRQLRGYGIVYDSVRHSGGECVAATRPSVLNNATPTQTLQYVWDGTRVIAVR